MIAKALIILSNPAFLRGFLLYRIAAATEHLDVISYLNPKHLIDVGANKGQFALAALSVVPQIRIDCFEPLATAACVLEKWSSGESSNIRVHRIALSSTEEQRVFFITSREDSSSLFYPTKVQQEMGGTIKNEIRVPTNRLENILSAQEISRPCLLKIDVQGGELDVLKGIGRCLAVIDFIYLEVSFLELYAKQPLFADIDDFMKSIGFKLRGVANCYIDPKLGPTQADILFSR